MGPAIVYGTAWKKERTAPLVELALDKGFRGIDTACQPRHYSEPGVGEGLAKACEKGDLSREDVFLQTKFTPEAGQDPNTIPYDPRAPFKEQVETSLRTSLANLRVDFIDSLVLHSPLSSWDDTLEVWRALEDAAETKAVGQIGISNLYDLKAFEKLCREAKVKPAVLQNRFFQQTRYDFDLRNYCNEQGIVYQSFWTLTANPHLLGHPTLRKVAEEHDATPPQILFAFLRSLGVQPLTGTTSAEHMEQDLKAVKIELSQAEKDAINELGPFF